jgi:predicted lipid-binding transport protein (Tim44 family)
MNGRVYDPVIARFLSPDPYVQAPESSQNFNRYSYALNNPLKYTDIGAGLIGGMALGGAIGGPNGAALGAFFGGVAGFYFGASTGTPVRDEIYRWIDNW